MRAPVVVNRSALLVLVSAGALGFGCAQVLGLDGPYEGAGPTSSGTASGGAGGSGAGGSGAGGYLVCPDGATMDCYTGDPATKGVGNCKTGTQTCANDAWGACQGDVVPGAEQCNGLDDDCDGTIDNGCPCAEGQKQSCYSGSMGTNGVGPCKGGMQTCAGGTWGPCVGEVPPAMETCNGIDDDCDSVVDDGNPDGGMDCAAPEQGACSKGAMTCVGGALSCQSIVQPSVENCTTPNVDESCDGPGSCTGAYTWVHAYGSAVDEHAFAVATDSSLNVVVVGDFDGSLDFGGGALSCVGPRDAFVVKLDPKGNHLWSKRYGDIGTDSARATAVDAAGNIFVAGVFDGSVDFGGGPLVGSGASAFVMKLDPSGNHVWSKAFVGASTFGQIDAAAGPGGEVVLSLVQEGTTNYGGGALSAQGQAIAVVKLDPAGTHMWSKIYSTGVCCAANSAVAVGGNGDIAVGATFQGNINFGGANVNANGQDALVFTLNAAGDDLWHRTGTGGSADSASGVAIDKNGNVLLSGTFQSNTLQFTGGALSHISGEDAFVVKFTSNGAFSWGKVIGMNGKQEKGNEVDFDGLGNVVLGGNTDADNLYLGGGGGSSRGPFLIKYDSAGTFIWGKSLTSSCCNNYPFVNLAVDGLGYTLIAGSFTLGVNFGGGVINPVAPADAFVAKYAP